MERGRGVGRGLNNNNNNNNNKNKFGFFAYVFIKRTVALAIHCCKQAWRKIGELTLSHLQSPLGTKPCLKIDRSTHTTNKT